MSSSSKPFALRGGGLLMGDRLARRPFLSPAPLQKDADVSWMPRARVGDNQGQDGACAIFAVASWAEVMYGINLDDKTRLDVYRQALENLPRKNEGLTFDEAFDAASAAGWLPGAHGLEDATWSDLADQPILGGYQVTPAFETDAYGCFDHDASNVSSGRHAMLIVARGHIRDEVEPRIYVENSWSLKWGWNGIGAMRDSLHEQLNLIMLKVV